MGVPTKPLRIAILFMSHPSSHLDLVGPPVTHPGCRWAKPAGYTNEVFLGGSCDPTQWRQQSAMPFLERAGISYYNPQATSHSHNISQHLSIHAQTHVGGSTMSRHASEGWFLISLLTLFDFRLQTGTLVFSTRRTALRRPQPSSSSSSTTTHEHSCRCWKLWSTSRLVDRWC